MGNYGYIESWLDRYDISNKIIFPFLKRLGYLITYVSDYGYYKVYKGDIALKLYEDEQGLTHINVVKKSVLMV